MAPQTDTTLGDGPGETDIIASESTAVKNYFQRQFTAFGDGATFQGELAEHLTTATLGASPECRNILDVGAGAGQLTRLLLKHWPLAEIVACDLFEARPPHLPRGVRWVRQDIDQFDLPGSFDLVVSNCALHWAHSLPATFASLATRLQNGGVFAAAIMCRGTLAELHRARQAAAASKPPARLLPTTAGVREAVERAGLTMERCDTVERVAHHASARELMRQLGRSGFTGGSFARGARMLTRLELEAVCREYHHQFADERGRIPATYKAVIFVARRSLV